MLFGAESIAPILFLGIARDGAYSRNYTGFDSLLLEREKERRDL